jgi:NAD(P)-dependent dehydrogenase (short-subunit alcohol dehydrogenase family)
MTPDYPKPPFPAQKQKMPGSTDAMQPRPDHGETSYKGSGKLKGMKAVITGGDSGIGRAVAIAFAREGADVLIAFLDESEEANEVKRGSIILRQLPGTFFADFSSTVGNSARGDLFMDKKIAGLLGAVAALSTANAAQASPAPTPVQTEVLKANSYANLLEPIPNAAAILRAVDERGPELAAAGEFQVAAHHHHHHHHRTVVIRRPRHHHHHHHHRN